MKKLVVLITSLSMFFAASAGFANSATSFEPSHTHEEVDHHDHSEGHDHHHHEEDVENSENVIAAPFVKADSDEHTHKHQHGPNTPPHEHSHNHNHSHGNTSPGYFVWIQSDSFNLKGSCNEPKQFSPTEDERPEDPYLASIFRPPIFLS